MATTEPRPQWIEKLYPSTAGQDHLGLASVSSDQILASLSAGINVLTVHPRYYSFYVFLLDEFWRSDRVKSRSAWVRFYRPREFIFSVAAQLCDQPEHGEMGGIIGSLATARMADPGWDSYDTTTDYIESDLGGYGFYYRSPMAVVDLIHPGGPGLPLALDIPTELRGKQVAAAFREAVQDTHYYREYFSEDIALVPRDVVLEYGRRACLCQLQREDAPDRMVLLDTFLNGGTRQRATARRETLQMFLDLAAQTDGFPIVDSSFRQLLFYGYADNGAAYVPLLEIEPTYRKWRMFQAREYYSFALNALWSYLCNWGLDHNGDVRPIPMSRIWAHVDEALDFTPLGSQLGIETVGLNGASPFTFLLAWLRAAIGMDESEDFDGACGLASPIQEHVLYHAIKALGVRAPAVIPAALSMLALAYLRFGAREAALRDEWVIARMGDEGRLSMDLYIRRLRERLSGDPTIRDVARWIIHDYVIVQHQHVAATKLPRNTYRFQRESNGLRFFNLPTGVDFGNARFEALSTAIHELGLCGDLGEVSHSLTSDGEPVLETGTTP